MVKPISSTLFDSSAAGIPIKRNVLFHHPFVVQPTRKLEAIDDKLQVITFKIRPVNPVRNQKIVSVSKSADLTANSIVNDSLCGRTINVVKSNPDEQVKQIRSAPAPAVNAQGVLNVRRKSNLRTPTRSTNQQSPLKEKKSSQKPKITTKVAPKMAEPPKIESVDRELTGNEIPQKSSLTTFEKLRLRNFYIERSKNSLSLKQNCFPSWLVSTI